MKRNGAGFAGYPSVNETNIYLIGEGITNRRLLGQKVGWDWTEIYEILSNSKQKLENEIAKLAPEGREQKTKFLERLVYSKLKDDVRTFFQEKS